MTVMAAAAWGADDFEAGLRDVLKQVGDAVSDALGEARRGFETVAGGQWPGGPRKHGSGEGRGQGSAEGHGQGWGSGGGYGHRSGWGRAGGFGGARGERSGGPWAWTFGGPRGRGPWGGGAAGTWSNWWPGAQPGQPGPSRGPKASRGDVRAAILALLSEEPRNGYQIMSEIAERSGGAWRPSPGAVYPALSQLADEGLIAGEEEDGRRTYSLTDAGRGYLAEHPERARGAWESAEQQQAWEVPGLFAEAARLGGGIVQIAHAGTHEQVVAAERLLARTRRELYGILAGDEDEDENDEPENDGPENSGPENSGPDNDEQEN
jgi:DNA-binding PadR family transcriptional regulator